MRIAGSPASPRNRAHNDQAKAASVPSEINVSIDAAAWRRFNHAARWNGHPPQTMTGPASASDSHCQLSNCSAGTMARTNTGRVRIPEMRSRLRRLRNARSCSRSSASSGSCWLDASPTTVAR